LALVSLVACGGALRAPRWPTVTAVVIGMAGWAAWAWCMTGSLMPVTLSAKHAFFSEIEQPFSVRLRLFGEAASIWLFRAGPVTLFAFARRLPWMTAALVLWLTTFLPAHPSGLFHNYGRYLHLLVVPLVLGTIWVCKSRRHLAMPLLSASIVWMAMLVPAHRSSVIGARDHYGGEMPALTSWLERHAPAAPILVHDVGYICQVPLSYVDLVGLKSPGARHIHARLTASGGARSRPAEIAAVACETRPRTLVVLGN
jgi:hypothetical protein